MRYLGELAWDSEVSNLRDASLVNHPSSVIARAYGLLMLGKSAAQDWFLVGNMVTPGADLLRVTRYVQTRPL